MNLIKTLALCTLLLCLKFSFSQQNTSLIGDESNNTASGNANIAAYAESLELFRKHPININTATKGELFELHLLNAIQINAIIHHREQFGEFLALYELQSVPGFDLETIKLILPYVEVKQEGIIKKEHLLQIFRGGQHLMVFSAQQPLQKVQGFLNGGDSIPTNDYLGYNFKSSLRYRYTKGSKLSMGINAESDIGEPLLKKQYGGGFDFYSAHFYLQQTGWLKQIALGDYHISIGQGLGIGSGFVINKSIEVMQVHRYASGIRPYRSLNEFGYFRGSALSVGEKKLNAIIYFSSNKVDGNTILNDTNITAEERFYNLIISGNHRTIKEMALKHTSRQQVYGCYFQSDIKAFHFGVGGNRNHMTDNTYVLHSDFNYYHKNYAFFGEYALQPNHGNGLILGCMSSVHKNAEVAIIYRNYDTGFDNALSNAFSNASRPNNENGFYVSANIRLQRALRFLCYADLFNSPKPAYRSNGATHGTDYTFAFQYQPSKSFKLEIRNRFLSDENNIPASYKNTTSYLIAVQKSTLRVQADFIFSNQITFRTRIEQTRSRNETGAQIGNMIFQDFHYSHPKDKYGIQFRYCLFNTNGADVRIYAFENDVPYSFSISQLNGTGVLYYVMFQAKLKRKAEIWVRYSRVHYPNQTSIGSGLDKINGNTREILKLLLKLHF